MGKPIGFQSFGLAETIDDGGEILRNKHLTFAIEWMPEDGEEPETVCNEDVVKHPVKFVVVGGGGVLPDSAQQGGIRPGLVLHQFLNR
jgi:hypothetical protein